MATTHEQRIALYKHVIELEEEGCAHADIELQTNNLEIERLQVVERALLAVKRLKEMNADDDNFQHYPFE